MKLTNKEKTIRDFAKAMRSANAQYIADQGHFTLRLESAWYAFVDACEQEVTNVQPK